ncbi:MAG: hypothetical protein ACREC3_14725, partial [Methyloceanibacter sp.]
DYLFSRYCPFWPGSFFRRQALIDVGLKYHQWTIGCLEFEIWCRLGTQHNVKYFPGFVSKYSVNEDQLSNTPKNFNEHLDNRTKVVEALFSEKGFFGADPVKKTACLYSQYYLFYHHTRTYKVFDQMEAIYHRMKALYDGMGPMERLEYNSTFSTLDINFDERTEVRGKIFHLWMRIASMVPRFIRRAISQDTKQAVREIVMNLLFGLYSYIFYYKKNTTQQEKTEAIFGLTTPSFSGRLYYDMAQLYYARGQISQALQMWRRAEELKDATIDGLACQAMLMSPTATHEGLMAAQRRWAERYAKPDPTLGDYDWKRYDGRRKIRVGYFCSSLDSDTIRFMMSAVIKQHDRKQFTVFGYSSSGVPPDIKRCFDVVRAAPGLSEEQFVQLVRSDEIDILVEMSGFSPFHRFKAMALRCAPIQISYLNHTGTSAVPNVDFILTDEVGVLREEDRYYTEKVWRLPGSFFCFNYDMVQSPPVAEPPFRSNGFITFGCFGSGGKINDDLIAIWARILARVPRSRIYIRNNQLTPADNRRFMLDRFLHHGIDAGRTRLEGGATREEIVKSYDRMDISLDTWPYCGGNT